MIRELIDRLTRSNKPETLVRVAEAQGVPDKDEYAFRRLSGTPTSYDLPQVFVERVLMECHWLYDSHGLAERIVERVATIITEAGFDYKVDFDPDFEKAYPTYAEVIRKRLTDFWYSDEVNIQQRSRMTVKELLLSGEHGWRTEVGVNGSIRIGDFLRADVKELVVDDFDRSKIREVVLRGSINQQDETLSIINIQSDPTKPGYGHLVGDCFYFRFGARASKRRGKPLLQAVIDELKAEKKFRILSMDRSLARMSVFLDVKLNGMTQEEVEAYAARQGTTLPVNGQKYYHNEQVETEFKSAKLESYELTNVYRTMFTVIAGMLGMPISWFGFGDGSTKATSETQQEPAEKDFRAAKEAFVDMLESLLYYVVDQAIVTQYVSGGAGTSVQLGDKSKLIRDCVTISVIPRPLVKDQTSGTPLQATTAAMEILSKDQLRALTEGGRKLIDAENEAALVNYALAKDGTGIKIVETNEPR